MAYAYKLTSVIIVLDRWDSSDLTAERMVITLVLVNARPGHEGLTCLNKRTWLKVVLECRN